MTLWIVSRDTSALNDFLVAAFDAVKLARVLDKAGGIGHVGDYSTLAHRIQVRKANKCMLRAQTH